jgi:hypothetical protein
MGESISRDELARVVADRLNADPGLVMRRLAASGDGERRGAPAKPAPPPGAGQPPPRAPARPLSARELQERALLTMCVASPVEGREFLERLTPELLSSPAVARARDWLLGHLEEPLAGLPRDDDELVSLVTYVYTRADREPGGRDAMELNFLQLEKSAIEARIEAERRSGGDPPVELQRRRAELAERIAHWETATSRL